ncbi:MAG: DUF3524 domain-containing protein [Gammaproteobacteria bacterium]|nr:DUF3524 domain-containing protein [Gammaproteobacteria bacterium]
MKKRILLLSGYDASSHRYWRNTLVEQLPEFEWTQIAMPNRHFYWRVRGNSLGFAFEHQDILNKDFDLLIVTSMVDLSSLRGFCPSLSRLPTIVYFHENQFAYPQSEHRTNLVNVQVTSIYTALCAEQLLFNSQYNQDSFLQGAESLLKRLPDQIPKGLVPMLESRSSVLPVPIKSGVNNEQQNVQKINSPVHIVWNHRWEYDKQPQVFFDAVKKLKKAGYEFRLHILGQSFRKQPDCFEQAKEYFIDEIETYGFQSKERYCEILTQADLVVSSALHDFQGLSLQEGITYGCMPIAPNRVAYPEYVPASGLYEIADEPEVEAHNFYRKLADVIKTNMRLVPDITHYNNEMIIPRYKDIFRETMESFS